MKSNMSTIVLVVLVLGVLYLAVFNKSRHHSIADLEKWLSSQLTGIALNLESDIEKDMRGEYPHAGKQVFDKRGMITYVLHDKNYTRFDISDKNLLSTQDLLNTAGYKKLDAKARSLGLSVLLEEKNVEGDGVDTFNELDEYTDDFPRYYTITVSGW